MNFNFIVIQRRKALTMKKPLLRRINLEKVRQNRFPLVLCNNSTIFISTLKGKNDQKELQHLTFKDLLISKHYIFSDHGTVGRFCARLCPHFFRSCPRFNSLFHAGHLKENSHTFLVSPVVSSASQKNPILVQA